VREQPGRQGNRRLALAGGLFAVRLAFEDAAVEIDVAAVQCWDQGGVADVAVAAAGVDPDQDVAGDMAQGMPALAGRQLGGLALAPGGP
jgi:hypothetical protein